ncbi:hypothetical protein DL766_004068 [Monosporascus sp. MC13-8B]|uniref:ADF-H domain-containing protein n=1 Tax=Monosporascus cannonballus TaxID=155416 RepID=A0ABY0HFP7_9PEZI|nr:hypothetical protein DL762_003117 [Monosporascus cannonballus]RYO99121.1 hypothetical protein DL763_001722 [Monosporascus cannonballus]RYP32228.1 hypothetical protein DL766_004068 [Monosporascus sp. MC13-8B]
MSARPTMPVRKKITKKLYKQLRQNQAHDTPIPAPTQLGIKFYLKNHRHINQIVIENDTDAQGFSAEPPGTPSKFILSQLEAQKIANVSRPSNELAAALVVTSEFLAKDPLEPPSYPTLCIWHSPDNHRTYCLFAYLTCPMESRIYSASELLELRGSYSPHIVLDKLKLNPDIVEIIKDTSILPLSQSSRLKKAKEEVSSSTESEDRILFKGKKQGQTINGEMEWKYRGRSGSEVTSTEPLSAPTGLDAQQSEGFQRFFKAVVSPTHVRVTAGGRIVPNTRATASPTTKWDKSGVEQEAHGSVCTSKNGKPETETGANSNALPPAGDQVLQGHPALFQHLGMPLPLIPVHNGIPLAYGFPHLQPSAPNIAQPGSSHANPDPEKPASIAQTDGAGKDNSQSAQIKISPPEQFDHTKPFFFNGHFVYPAMGAAPMQGLPPAFIPNTYFAPGVLGSHAALAAARVGPMGQLPSALPMLGPPGYLPGPYGVAPAAGGTRVAQQPASQQPKQVVMPPISSIRPSEITRQQLNQLRTAAKYYEDQLLYNKHQIDEKSTREQVHAIKAKIAQFDHDLKMQLSFEAAYYPKQTQAQSSESTTAVPAREAQGAAPCNPLSGRSSMKENRSDNVSQDGSIGSGKCVPLRQKQSSDHSRSRAKGFKNRNAIGINSFRSESNSSAALDALEAHIKLQLELDKEKKSCLPSAAALAPPFQPGTAPSAPSASGDGQNESQPWLTAEYNHQWQSTKSYPQDQRGSWDTIQSTNTYLASDSNPAEVPFSTRTFAPSSYSAPYLVGQLPQGVNPYSARGSDYVYARELTEEEKRARHVYWGQVPTKGTGLPKFDGKDFYPPSPAKMDDKPPGPPRVPTGRPELDYGFQLSSAESDPFRSSRDGASIRSQESSQKLSRAIPIINPDSLRRRGTTKTPKDFDRTDASKLLRPADSTGESASDGNSTASSRRAIERSSNKSGHDLWQTVLKKGSASGTALPSAISSTTATGYLPQYFGHAAASLSPAILNATGSPARGGEAKLSERDSGVSQGTADMLGENRPPRDGSCPESDTTKDIRERMLRDAERRGLIGSGW